VIPRNKSGILTGYVEIAFRIEHRVKGVTESRIQSGISLCEDPDKIVLPIVVKCAFELEHFAVFVVGVDHIEISVRPENESTKFTQGNACRKTLGVQSLPQLVPFAGIDVNVV
jgi:hypothetical protein